MHQAIRGSEIVRHYMVLPVAVTMVAAVVGNMLGYTLLEKIFCKCVL